MKRKINYTHIAEPTVFENVFPTYLTNETMMARKQKVLQRMETEKFDQLSSMQTKSMAVILNT